MWKSNDPILWIGKNEDYVPRSSLVRSLLFLNYVYYIGNQRNHTYVHMYVHRISSFIELSLPSNLNQGLGVPCSQPWGLEYTYMNITCSQPASEAEAMKVTKKVTMLFVDFVLFELLQKLFWAHKLLNVIYSEKATKFCKIFTWLSIDCTYMHCSQ